jgi:hypothetical protein
LRERKGEKYFKVMADLESAKSILCRELEDCPYVKDFLWGNAATQRKIQNYVIESVKAGVDSGDCIDWFKLLLRDNGIDDEYKRPISLNTYSSDIQLLYDTLIRHIRHSN